VGRFFARYGPDNELLGQFSLRTADPSGVPKMLDQAIERLNGIYTQALLDGRLRPDPSLVIEEPVNVSELDLGNVVDSAVETATTPAGSVAGVTTYTIQFDTPDVAAVNQGEGLVRGVPGVRSAATSSLALGGVSVMQVSYEGTIDALKAALEGRGLSVSAAGSTLRIARRGGAAAGGQ